MLSLFFKGSSIFKIYDATKYIHTYGKVLLDFF